MTIERQHLPPATTHPVLSWPRSVLAAVIVLTFWPAISGTYLADDLYLIANNQALQGNDVAALLTEPVLGASGGYWRPAMMLLVWLGDLMGGAAGVHMLAIALHFVNAVAVLALAKRVVPATMALWVALLFAVHPMQVESVAWCAAINDPLWSGCALQAMLAALRFRDSGKVRWLGLAGAFALLAVMAKETGLAAVPLTFAAVMWLGTKNSAKPPRLTLLAAVMSLVVLVWLLLRAQVQGEWPGQVLLGTSVEPWAGISMVTRAAQIFAAQVVLLVSPWPMHPVRMVPDSATARAVATVALVLVCGLLLWTRRWRSRQLVMFVTALVALPVVPIAVYHQVVGSYPIADRYLYLPVFGVALALAACQSRWLSRSKPARLVLWGLVAVSAGTSFAATWNWQDSKHMVHNALAYSPRDPMVLTMAGDYELDRAFSGNLVARIKAQELYQLAVAEADHEGDREQVRRAIAKSKLGLAWCRILGDHSSAQGKKEVLAAFREAVEADPGNANSWVGLAAAHMEFRQFADAVAMFGKALEVDVRSTAARSGLDQARAALAAQPR